MAIVLGVFAHPDDESFGPGGALAKLAQEHHLEIVCCTDGDHQAKGLKNVRDKELLESAKILGAKKVHFLEFVDGDLSNNSYHRLEEALKLIMDSVKPHTIITFDPNGVSGHIDHMVVTSVINQLFSTLPYLQKIMYYCVRHEERKEIRDYFVYMPPGRRRQEADEIVDVSAVWDIKVKAMRAHHSQKSDCDWILGVQEKLPKEEYFLVRSKS